MLERWFPRKEFSVPNCPGRFLYQRGCEELAIKVASFASGNRVSIIIPEKGKKEKRKGGKKKENLGASLTNNDGAGLGDLITVNLDAEPTAFGIATILGTPSSFLVGILNDQQESPKVVEKWPWSRSQRTQISTFEERRWKAWAYRHSSECSDQVETHWCSSRRHFSAFCSEKLIEIQMKQQWISNGF